jgi:flagellar biosynthesis protein FlhG
MTRDGDREAQRLTPSQAKPKWRVIAVTAGKGGVGKSSISIGLACATAAMKQRVLLVDADLSLANIDVLMGLKTERTLEDVFKGNCELKDIILQGPCGVDILPGASGVSQLSRLSYLDHTGLINACNQLPGDYDFIFIDTPSGISENAAAFLRAAQEVIVVVCNEATSIMDAFALMKIASQAYHIHHFHFLANQVSGPSEGRELYLRLRDLAHDVLDSTLTYLGAVPFDECLREAIKQQRPIEIFDGTAKSAWAFRKVSHALLERSTPADLGYTSPFFLEKLLGISADDTVVSECVSSTREKSS